MQTPAPQAAVPWLFKHMVMQLPQLPVAFMTSVSQPLVGSLSQSE
jgi:hypothetical protein